MNRTSRTLAGDAPPVSPLRCPPAPTLLTRDRGDRHRRRHCEPPTAVPTGMAGHFFVALGYTNLWTIDVGELWLCAAGHRHRLCRDGYFRRSWLPAAGRRVFCELDPR